MDYNSALKVIELLRTYCISSRLGLYMAGSVAYTGALSDPASFSQCDDIDSIFIYNRLTQLENCPFFKVKSVYRLATRLLESGEADMFSSKSVIDGIRLSADFISLDYFNELADEPFQPSDSFRIKLTDSREKPSNEYGSFNGSRYIYHKKPHPYEDCFLYKLPIRIYEKGEYYTGALYNKFIHNPAPLVRIAGMDSAHNRLLGRYARHFHNCAAKNPSASLMSAMLFKDRFSQGTNAFLEKHIFLADGSD